MRILVVDDQVAFRETLIIMLQTEPIYEVVGEVGTCREAIDQAKSLRPDLILLDVKLPDGSGIDIIRELKYKIPGVKIVILSGYDVNKYLLEAIRNGASGYLLKGFEIEYMLAALKALEKEEFVLSPKMTGMVLLDYSRLKATLDKGIEIYRLTPRERDVLAEVCLGVSNREIAKRLVISENTVRIHIQKIFKKLNLKNRRQAQEKYAFTFSLENPSEESLHKPSSKIKSNGSPGLNGKESARTSSR